MFSSDDHSRFDFCEATLKDMLFRHGVSSIPELKLIGNSEIGFGYLKKMQLELINWGMEVRFATNRLNPQIKLPFNFLIQKYLFNENPA